MEKIQTISFEKKKWKYDDIIYWLEKNNYSHTNKNRDGITHYEFDQKLWNVEKGYVFKDGGEGITLIIERDE